MAGSPMWGTIHEYMIQPKKVILVQTLGPFKRWSRRRMKCNSLTSKWSSLEKIYIYLKCTFCDIIHIKVFWSLVRNKNRTCIIHPHLHAVIPIKMNQVGHAFKGCVDSDTLQEKALQLSYFVHQFMATVRKNKWRFRMRTLSIQRRMYLLTRRLFFCLWTDLFRVPEV